MSTSESNPPIEIRKSSRLSLSLALLALLGTGVVYTTLAYAALKSADSEQQRSILTMEERLKKLEEAQIKTRDDLADLRGDMKVVRAWVEAQQKKN